MASSLTSFTVTGNWQATVNADLSSTSTTLNVEPVTGFVHFQPRVPKGMTFHVNDYLIQTAYSSLQTVYLLGQPNSGTFRLQFQGVWTAALPYNITPANLQAALESLPGIAPGDITVTAALTPQAWDVRFQGALGSTEVDAMIGDGTALRNSSGYRCAASVTRTSTGGPEIVADTAIALSTITGRIVNGRLCSINRADSPGVSLLANTAVLEGETFTDLMWDVSFSELSWNGQDGYLAPFAFKGPSTATTISITDPALVKHPYAPNPDTWQPVDTWSVGSRGSAAHPTASVTSLAAVRRDDWRSRVPKTRRRTA